MSLNKVFQKLKGGPGSGNFGHGGRPGKRGGSAPSKGGGGLSLSKDDKETLKRGFSHLGVFDSLKVDRKGSNNQAAFGETKGNKVQELGDALVSAGWEVQGRRGGSLESFSRAKRTEPNGNIVPGKQVFLEYMPDKGITDVMITEYAGP